MRRRAVSAPRSTGAPMWNRMRMDPTDLADVSGYTYTYLMNGAAPAGNWTGLFARWRESAVALHQWRVDELLRRAHSGTEAHGGRERWPGRRTGNGR
jgi:hypothetical protein